jgi:hypothetical protein
MQATENLPEVLRLWEVGPEPTTAAIPFDAASPTPEAAIWRIDLPAQLETAQDTLRRNEILLQASDLALATVPERLDKFIRQAQARGAVSFAAPAAGSAEAGLFTWLESIEGDPAQVSFSLGDEARAGLQKSSEAFQQSVEHLLRLVANFAWVETQMAGELLGRTVVNWTGDMNTVWGEGITPEHYHLHYRSLALALASRATLLRAFITATQGAMKLAILLTTPGGAVLALPAAWQFVNQVLADLGKYQSLINPNPHKAE